MIFLVLSYPPLARSPQRTWFGRIEMNGYQLALRTPGIRPDSAISLKQILQMPNFLRNARDRPHLPHRLCWRAGNFGFRFDFSTMAFLAIYISLKKVRTSR